MAILIINVCKEKLHYFEFVKPIEDILTKAGTKFYTKNYKDLREHDWKHADKIIITGTSLKDNDFLSGLEKFSWLNDYEKPVLGICAGSHIMGLMQGEKLEKNSEIGLKELSFDKDFLGIEHGDKIPVYELHNWTVLPKVYVNDNHFACVFHPEVRNRKIIENFAELED